MYYLATYHEIFFSFIRSSVRHFGMSTTPTTKEPRRQCQHATNRSDHRTNNNNPFQIRLWFLHTSKNEKFKMFLRVYMKNWNWFVFRNNNGLNKIFNNFRIISENLKKKNYISLKLTFRFLLHPLWFQQLLELQIQKLKTYRKIKSKHFCIFTVLNLYKCLLFLKSTCEQLKCLNEQRQQIFHQQNLLKRKQNQHFYVKSTLLL